MWCIEILGSILDRFQGEPGSSWGTFELWPQNRKKPLMCGVGGRWLLVERTECKCKGPEVETNLCWKRELGVGVIESGRGWVVGDEGRDGRWLPPRKACLRSGFPRRKPCAESLSANKPGGTGRGGEKEREGFRYRWCYYLTATWASGTLRGTHRHTALGQMKWAFFFSSHPWPSVGSSRWGCPWPALPEKRKRPGEELQLLAGGVGVGHAGRVSARQ